MKNYYLQNLINECIMLEQDGHVTKFNTDLLEAQAELLEIKQLLMHNVSNLVCEHCKGSGVVETGYGEYSECPCVKDEQTCC